MILFLLWLVLAQSVCVPLTFFPAKNVTGLQLSEICSKSIPWDYDYLELINFDHFSQNTSAYYLTVNRGHARWPLSNYAPLIPPRSLCVMETLIYYGYAVHTIGPELAFYHEDELLERISLERYTHLPGFAYQAWFKGNDKEQSSHQKKWWHLSFPSPGHVVYPIVGPVIIDEINLMEPCQYISLFCLRGNSNDHINSQCHYPWLSFYINGNSMFSIMDLRIPYNEWYFISNCYLENTDEVLTNAIQYPFHLQLNDTITILGVNTEEVTISHPRMVRSIRQGLSQDQRHWKGYETHETHEQDDMNQADKNPTHEVCLQRTVGSCISYYITHSCLPRVDQLKNFDMREYQVNWKHVGLYTNKSGHLVPYYQLVDEAELGDAMDSPQDRRYGIPCEINRPIPMMLEPNYVMFSSTVNTGKGKYVLLIL